MFSNKNVDLIPVMDSYEGGLVNFMLEPGQIFEVISVEDNKTLILNTDGLAGWLEITDLFNDDNYILINDRNLINHFSEFADRVPSRGISFKSSDYADSKMTITISLKGLTVHAVCKDADYNKVYPVGVGVIGKNKKSITPTSESQNKEYFLTWPDNSNKWYYVKKRYDPAYFGGYPFLRLNIENSKNQHTYGLHGPITKDNNDKWILHRGYVSHGCMRMREKDVVELYNVAVKYPGARVYIIEDFEYNPDGTIVDCDYPRK